ncbi:unnamed protein product [Heligmosomoides polygyrus]|uniref:Phlebovirus_G2 domain-containing protein n=1 Tax=Heligmosomoides polygyrus TaxID=6339 RepID=A0A183G844_HELPZ|nr:unnamed protein product [Heligmosomoides polygyrus]
MFVTLCYFLFHVPVIIGNPLLYLLRTIGRIGFLITKSTLKFLSKLLPNVIGNFMAKICRSRRRRLWSEIAVFLAVVSRPLNGCQDVDIYDHQIQSCRQTAEGELCSVDTSEVLKINPFKQEVCLRLHNNSTSLMEVRLQWKNLELICERETSTFSRSTRYELLDSKTCLHAGSCTGQKCGAVNRTSRIMELHKANDYPRVTECVESCGGPGCDRFYPSSGCPFYRIFLVPNDDAVYEFFRCARWREIVYLQMTVSGHSASSNVHKFYVKPNQPKRIPPFTITLSSLSIPPTPFLSSRFLTDGTRTAIAPLNYLPPLRCSTWEHASNLTCNVTEDCKCSPAEVKILCDCKDVNLTSHILDLNHRLPILRPNMELRTHHEQVISRILHSPTAEFILKTKGQFHTISLSSDAVCTIQNTQCIGCYNCAKGVRANITCTSSTQRETAEIRCGNEAFTVPCSSQGSQSKLRFVSSKAWFHANCSVQCGSARHHFEIVGILSMSSEELEERLKRELLRKISFVERSTARPTEPVIQQRLRFYGEKCH